MVRKIAALMALIPATFAAATPAYGQDTITGFNTAHSASTMFFVSIPLDGKSRKERETGYGFALQGKQQAFVVDTRMLKNNFGLETLAGLEIKWLLAGAAAVATAAAVGTSSSTRTETQAASQQQQQIAAATSSTTSGGSTTTSATSTTSSTGGTSGGTSTGGTSGGSTGGTTTPCPVTCPR